ncbi:MAG TPA: hypothetical protein VFJ30_03730 [Phycisphaerae bacterium]|nr:hypothetical protein [Phycisphaerae bacterium]
MAQHSALLKKGTFTLAGSRRLDGAAAAPAPGTPGSAAQPKARIVQEHPDGVVIEVTCSCGRTTHVQCDYVPAPAAAPQPSGPTGPEAE